MIYTATAYQMNDGEGYTITPVVIERAQGPNPHVAMEKLAAAIKERDPFVDNVNTWVADHGSANLREWIEEDDSKSYYCGEGKFRYEMQGDK